MQTFGCEAEQTAFQHLPPLDSLRLSTLLRNEKGLQADDQNAHGKTDQPDVMQIHKGWVSGIPSRGIYHNPEGKQELQLLLS